MTILKWEKCNWVKDIGTLCTIGLAKKVRSSNEYIAQ